MTVPYIDYNGLEEFHTLKSVCSLFKIASKKRLSRLGVGTKFTGTPREASKSNNRPPS